MQLLLQGPVYKETTTVVKNYLSLPWVDKIVISCWENDPDLAIKDSRIFILRNKDVANPSVGNVNRQIVSSQLGLKHITSDQCAKMRTDQIISVKSMAMLKRFYEKFKGNDIMYADGTGPESPIFVLGMYTFFPFHPRDHVFWGRRTDLIKLFDIPLYSEASHYPMDLNRVLRPEAYIGMHYYAKFNPVIEKFVADPKTYLIDNAPKINESLAVYNEIRDKVFKVFPRVQMRWPKHNLVRYHYHVGAQFSEYWHDAKWEPFWKKYFSASV